MLRFSNLMQLPPAGRGASHVWYGSANCAGVDLASEDAGASLRALSGSFAIVAETADAVLLAADFIRSIPIAWIASGGEIVVSNDGVALAKRFGLKMDPIAREEYLHTSYTIGERTLFRGLNAILPGELVRISKADGSFTRRFYWELEYSFDSSAALPELIDKFDACLKQVFGELIDRLNGRTALIPLSGGCDSRIVAVMLKRLGYENVVCFSYGRPGNSDSTVSERVAKALGYPWEFVEYSADVWAGLYSSDVYFPYLAYSSCASGMGTVRSFPAMQRLLDKYRDCVVIPGHALDFNMGSHIPAAWAKAQSLSRAQYSSLIVSKHYHLRRHPERCDLAAWQADLPQSLSVEEAVRAMQRFEWLNRQCKFTANELRKYEFLGYAGWEIPFWDRRVSEFTSKLPVELLQGRKFQYHYMMERIDPVAGIHQQYLTPPQKVISGKSLRLPGMRGIAGALRCVKRRKRNPMAYFDHMGLLEYLNWMRKCGTAFEIHPKTAEDSVRAIERECAK